MVHVSSFQDLVGGLCESIQRKMEASEIGEFSEIPPDQQLKLTRSILICLGQLKFRHVGLLNSLATLLSSRIADDGVVNNKDLSAFLLTTAALDYIPKNSENIYEVSAGLKFVWVSIR